MPHPRPLHLQRHKTRHGKFVWVFQIGNGPLVRIRGEYGSPEFTANYHTAVANHAASAPTIKAATGTLEWAWLTYKQSGAWRELSAATHRQRDNIMSNVMKNGNPPLAKINLASIEDGLERRSGTPSAARNFLDTMRGMFVWLVKKKLASSDPTTGLKVKRPKSRGFLEWSYDEILKYEERWPLGTRERVMLDVYCYTGLRRGDAAAVGKQHVSNGVITLRTEKSQRETVVHLPMLEVLKRTLDAGPTGELAFIVTSRGKPYTKESLGNVFKDACRAAGIVDKSAHGLRKAAATRAADNGATTHELMAIFGWKTVQQAEVYTRAADRKRLAARAMDKLET
jgi:integrase